jgi:hypothetical protein
MIEVGRIKGMGRNQRVALGCLLIGDWRFTSQLADGAGCETDAMRLAITGLKGRGFVIESEPVGSAGHHRHRLLQYQDKPWLPVQMIGDHYRMTQKDGFTEDEARQIIEDHVAVYARRAAA